MGPFPDPARFGFTARLEAAFESLRAECLALDRARFEPSPDSLTTAEPPYDENGWLYLELFAEADTEELRARRARLPETAAACAAVPGMVNAGLSLFLPGTHLYPHRGERADVLRCHLPLEVPAGDCGIASGDLRRPWEAGRCLILDDSFEHEAWNHGDSQRTNLLITFSTAAGRKPHK